MKGFECSVEKAGNWGKYDGLKALSHAKAGDLLWIEDPFCATDILLERDVITQECMDSWTKIHGHKQANGAMLILHSCLFQRSKEDILKYIKSHYCGTKVDEIANDLLQHFHEVSGLSKKNLQKLYSTILDNTFVATSVLRLNIIDNACLFQRTCKMNHRCCRPNCEWFVDPVTCRAMVYAIRDIKPNDWLTHSYTKTNDHIPVVEYRKTFTKKSLGFHCECEDCKSDFCDPPPYFNQIPSPNDPAVRESKVWFQSISDVTDMKKATIVMNLFVDKFKDSQSTQVWGTFWEKVTNIFRVLSQNALLQGTKFEDPICDIDDSRSDVLWKSLLNMCKNADFKKELESKLVYSAAFCLLHLTSREDILEECVKLLKAIEIRWISEKNIDFRPQRIYFSRQVSLICDKLFNN